PYTTLFRSRGGSLHFLARRVALLCHARHMPRSSGSSLMAQYDYDLFTIGAGSGGVRASRIAASHGAKVAVAEEFRVGGTCVIRGCVPKKMLVYSAHFAEDLQDARHFGWQIESCTFDWTVLRDNVLRDVDRLNGL